MRSGSVKTFGVTRQRSRFSRVETLTFQTRSEMLVWAYILTVGPLVTSFAVYLKARDIYRPKV